ncbi:MAG: hypothetical protein ABS78_02900 [Phenylobacterium sp. SCN 70-31]|nr:MAG: hypothetical protein ABS78_02900 [Phenylobacterium sp. SCN 70-31]
MLSIALGGQDSLAQTPPAAAELKPYRIADFEKVVLPSAPDAFAGKTFRLKIKGDTLISFGLGYRFVAMNSEPISANVGGLEFTIPPGEIFTQRKVKGGAMSDLPAQAVILCQAPVQRNFGQALVGAATLGLTEFAARYLSDVQVCGVDADVDGKMEKLFLGGANRSADLGFSDIVPVAYVARENFAVPGVNLAVRITDVLLFGPQITVGVMNGQKFTALSTLSFEKNGKMVRSTAYESIKVKKLPQDIAIGSALLTVKSYDPIEKMFDVEVKRDFEVALVDWIINPEVIYIYF